MTIRIVLCAVAICSALCSIVFSLLSVKDVKKANELIKESESHRIKAAELRQEAEALRAKAEELRQRSRQQTKIEPIQNMAEQQQD